MLSLYEDSFFTFRFSGDRVISRFRLEGVDAGRHVAVFRVDYGTSQRQDLLARAIVGEGGWVNLPEPMIVKAGDAFIADCGNRSLPSGDTSD